MGILGWIIIGGLAGWIASKVMKTDKDQGLLANIAVGILGGFLVNTLGGEGITGFDVWSFVVALLGAVILLAILKAVRK